jgi:hypothetical protein
MRWRYAEKKETGLPTAIRSPSSILRYWLRADLEPGEAGDGQARVSENLADGQLVVLGVVLLEQCDLLEVGLDTTLNDLGQRGGRLALAESTGVQQRSVPIDAIIHHAVWG